MKNQPFLIPLSGLILGIFSAEFISKEFALYLSVFILCVFIFSALISGFHKSFVVGVFIAFFLTGLLNAKIQNRHIPLPDHLINKNIWIKLEIGEIYKPSEKFRKYKAKIISANAVNIPNHYALLYWQRDYEDLNPGDEVWVNAKIQTVPKLLNPHQFDYALYLKRQEVYYSIFPDSVSCKEKNGSSLKNSITRFKKEIYAKSIQNGYSKNSADIIGAMLLGDRTEMDKELEDQYRKTGVVHILSISGLHVMMVYSIFMFVFYPLLFLPNGRIVRIFVCLSLIWAYAFFAGLQPPVVRSALMISIYYLTVIFRRKPDIYHTLTVSAFILLLIDTDFLFDVGFQLSFSAVFFIVWFMPVFSKILKPKTRFSKILTGFLGTSIAAQLGTFPFSVYYFNQTSALFLAGNAVMVLASYFMIAGGMLCIGFTCFGLFPKIWIGFFNAFIRLCNDYIEWLSGFDALVFEKIPLTLLEACLILVGIIFLRFVLLKPRFQYIIFLMGLIFIFEAERLYQAELLKNKEEMILFHQNRNSIIGMRKGKKMDVFIFDLNDSSRIRKFILEPYATHEQVDELKLFSLEDSVHSFYYKNRNVLFWKNKILLILRENDRKDKNKAGFMLIRNNLNINLSSIPDSTKIIIDGSNYPNYLSHEKRVWRTREKGAFVITE